MIIVVNEGETVDEAIERTMKEKYKQDYEYQLPRKLDDKFINKEGFIKVLVDNLNNTFDCYQKIVSFENGEKPMSFKDILKMFKIKLKKYSVVYLWIESYMSGEIWKYSQADNDKELIYHGETRGFV